MAGLDPATQGRRLKPLSAMPWVAGSIPAMTGFLDFCCCLLNAYRSKATVGQPLAF
ncbi:MAG: hypothetical protein HOP13_08905 [Alphaproteobacteria bacterium]|nr:hypothetical protein [Alphaproteobacteria bacterium]